MCFRGEMNHGCCGGEGIVVMEKGKREKQPVEHTRGYFLEAIGLENDKGLIL